MDIVDFVLGLFLGMIGGALLYYLSSKGKTVAAEKKIESLETEINEYRGKVDTHFLQSAELFRELTERYRDIYSHMAKGAQSLCSEETKALQADMVTSALLNDSYVDSSSEEVASHEEEADKAAKTSESQPQKS